MPDQGTVEALIVDLFAGPGGWDLTARRFGLDPLGIEYDEAVCRTRRAAGLRTVHADVSALDPLAFMREHMGNGIVAAGPLDGLIGSPPCQAFSMAGSGEGRKAIDAYLRWIEHMARGGELNRAALDDACQDPRAHLVLEPLRWALALRPGWVALEQVEPVLPLWEAIATALKLKGYMTWTGILSAEQYGVPQTRKRAFMLASRDLPVGPPPPTHQRYIPPRKFDNGTESLFDAGEPERIVAAEDINLLPWVSMAEALGWGMTARPYPVIASGRSTGGPDKEKVGGSGARETLYEEQAAGRWRFRATNDRPNAAERELDEPAPSLAFGHNPPRWVEERPATTVAGDSRIWPPGHKINGDDIAAGRLDYEERRGENAIRVSFEEAAVLQSFPDNYPWQGTKTKVFEQIGNAVPVLLAEAVLKAVVPVESLSGAAV